MKSKNSFQSTKIKNIYPRYNYFCLSDMSVYCQCHFPPEPSSGLLSPWHPLTAWPRPNLIMPPIVAELGRGVHFLSDSARPVFRDSRDSTHSQRVCSKLYLDITETESALGFHEKMQKICQTCQDGHFLAVFSYYICCPVSRP